MASRPFLVLAYDNRPFASAIKAAKAFSMSAITYPQPVTQFDKRSTNISLGGADLPRIWQHYLSASHGMSDGTLSGVRVNLGPGLDEASDKLKTYLTGGPLKVAIGTILSLGDIKTHLPGTVTRFDDGAHALTAFPAASEGQGTRVQVLSHSLNSSLANFLGGSIDMAPDIVLHGTLLPGSLLSESAGGIPSLGNTSRWVHKHSAIFFQREDLVDPTELLAVHVPLTGDERNEWTEQGNHKVEYYEKVPTSAPQANLQQGVNVTGPRSVISAAA
jgi:hypothetical protein